MSNSKLIALLSAAFFSTSAALAGPISFVPNGDNNCGSVKCDVPLLSLGSMPLRTGSASISGRVITIKSASELSETPRTVLVGSVLRSELNLSSEPANVSGLALFLMGDWASDLDDGASKDTIFRKEGHLEGRILGIENDSISVKLANGSQQRVALNSILYIRSPRVFVFKINVRSKQALHKDTEFQAEAMESTFRPTETARTLSGSVIPQSEKKDDLLGPGGMPNMQSIFGKDAGGLGGGGLQGLNSFGAANPMSSFGGMNPNLPNGKNDSFDNGESAAQFSTVNTRWGKQKLTLPPGMLE
ncbi:MAG: hypothetical protein K2X27_09985 [Candidatus Obscuribacterales bacterium]|nr:hypothetical protein [Candidatus Obscuribacterales bacterium]